MPAARGRSRRRRGRGARRRAWRYRCSWTDLLCDRTGGEARRDIGVEGPERRVERGESRIVPRHRPLPRDGVSGIERSEEHTSELQSLMRISYAVFCLKKKKNVKANQRRLITHHR